MSKVRTLGSECKVIPFKDVSIGQEFESPMHVNFNSLFAGCQMVKRSRENYGLFDLTHFSEYDVGADHFKNGCIVRIADCISTQEAEEGMTLRDYFAGLAMQGMRAAGTGQSQGIAEVAYAQADAMLKAREAELNE